MAANTILNTMSGGDVIKTDDLTTYKIQGVKLVTGAATVDGGYVTNANPLPIGISVGGTLVTGANALPVSIASTGFGASSGTVTRPANTTAYAAGDVVGATAAAITFANAAGYSGQSVRITGFRFMYNVTAVQSGQTSFRLYLYSVTPPSALADNAVWDLPSGDRASFRGYIDLGSLVDLGSTIYVQADNVNHCFLAGGTSLFGYLVTNGAYTPASAETFQIDLMLEPV
jgi:hypothetical protein